MSHPKCFRGGEGRVMIGFGLSLSQQRLVNMIGFPSSLLGSPGPPFIIVLSKAHIYPHPTNHGG